MNVTSRQIKDAVWALVESQYKPGMQYDIDENQMQYVADQLGTDVDRVWMCCTHEMEIWVF